MKRHLIIGDDSVYEIDDACMREKYGAEIPKEEAKDSKRRKNGENNQMEETGRRDYRNGKGRK